MIRVGTRLWEPATKRCVAAQAEPATSKPTSKGDGEDLGANAPAGITAPPETTPTAGTTTIDPSLRGTAREKAVEINPACV